MTWLVVSEWLKKWWRWLAAGAAVVGGFLLGLLVKKRPVVVQGDNPEKTTIENATGAAEKTALGDKQAGQQAAAENHAQSVAAVVEQQKQDTPRLEDDPDATNEYLKKTGNAVREP
jgi:apolipoprotein N-acyltransferase